MIPQQLYCGSSTPYWKAICGTSKRVHSVSGSWVLSALRNWHATRGSSRLTLNGACKAGSKLPPAFRGPLTGALLIARSSGRLTCFKLEAVQGFGSGLLGPIAACEAHKHHIREGRLVDTYWGPDIEAKTPHIVSRSSTETCAGTAVTCLALGPLSRSALEHLQFEQELATSYAAYPQKVYRRQLVFKASKRRTLQNRSRIYKG